ncbi:striatin-interacting protein 1-like isoform X1, partial [Silurus asotus]
MEAGGNGGPIGNNKQNKAMLTGKTRAEFTRNQRKDSEGVCEAPDLEFEYFDSDKWAAELSELYSYTEGPEFQLNRKCFEEDLHTHLCEKRWVDLSVSEHRAHALRLLDGLDVTCRVKRLKVARAVLYMAQGTFAECSSEAELQYWVRYNVFLLLEVGTFSALVELLSMEIDNNAACSSAVRKPAISLADSTDLRVLLNIMYLIVETIRHEDSADSPEWSALRETFKTELGSSLYNSEPVSVMLFAMVTKFCSGHAPHFPMKKVLLLLWKSILFTLGGFEQLQSLKVCKRAELGLPNLPEDSIRVMKSMRASSPPTSACDIIDQQQRRTRREHKVCLSSPHTGALIKQENLEAFNEKDPFKAEDAREEEEDGDDNENPLEPETFPLERDEVIAPPIPHPSSDRVSFPKGLPWAPKVREKDIENFLECSRSKFIGYTLGSDTDTVVGLPRPIHESIKTLKQHKYISIAEVQISREEEYQKTPLSGGEEQIKLCATELLYQGILPSLPQYMIALLKILLAAAPTSKAKTDSINILADVLPEEMPTTVLQSMKLGVDVNRHKEIIVKAISAILLLLLKHFKLNHIYQFEYMAQHLVFANCIPLILKFFNQNIMSYITAKNSISVLDFPYCVLHELPELTADSLEAGGDNNQFCWRNLFSCINLLRILNKLTKWKHSRTMMLVVFKSAPILKRALKVKHAMLQLYVLKLLKVQTKYLGRQWRKSNMKTMSAIYQKVRHRLNDDWAYGNDQCVCVCVCVADLDARPWDFQAEECSLRASIERFNARRYDVTQRHSDLVPVDNCLQSVLGQNVPLPDDFHTTYDLWLEREVFSKPICWEELLQ